MPTIPDNNTIATTDSAGTPIERRDIAVITTEIQFYKNQAGEAILEIGHRLNEAKDQLQHGEWLDWLRDKVEFSDATAQRFMRIAREYSNPSPVTDLGIAKAVALLALPATERDEFMSESHEVDGNSKTVDEMNKRELEQAVREKREALEAKAVALRQAEDRLREMQDAVQKANEAEAEAERVQQEKAELERELEELRSAEPELPPEPDQQTLEALRKEAATAAKKDAEEKLKKKIAKADEEKTAAEAALVQAEQERDRIKRQQERDQAEAAARIRDLEKQLVTAGSQTISVFKAHFEGAQTSLNKLLGCIEESDDDAAREKLSGALRALCEKVLEQVGNDEA